VLFSGHLGQYVVAALAGFTAERGRIVLEFFVKPVGYMITPWISSCHLVSPQSLMIAQVKD
jgi:hypothetical protein